ncbi:MAG: hypothetical protein R3F05_19625 [Planctomycetota bacterium]
MAAPHRHGTFRLQLLSALVALAALATTAVRATAEEDFTVPPIVARKAGLEPGVWPLAGGSPTRAGYSISEPVVGPYEEAWRLELDGTIEGEPLVHHGFLVVTTVDDDYTFRTVWLVRTSDQRTWKVRRKHPTPLQPVMTRRGVAWREGDGKVVVYRYGRTGLARRGLVAAPDDTSAFDLVTDGARMLLIAGNGRYVAYDGLGKVGDGRTQDMGRGTTRAPMYGGLFGGVMPVLSLDDPGNLWLDIGRIPYDGLPAAWDEQTAGPAFLGQHVDRGDSSAAGQALLFDQDLFLRPGGAIALSDGSTANTVWVRRDQLGSYVDERGARRQTPLKPLWLGNLRGMPVGNGRLWVGRGDMFGTKDELFRAQVDAKGQVRGYTIASRNKNPELLGGSDRMTLAQEVLYLGQNVIDVERMRRLPSLPVEPTTRVVPAEGMLLVVSAPSTLIALRRAGARVVGTPAYTGPAAEAGEGVLVEMDGTVHEGPWTLADALADDAADGTYARSDVALALTADGKVAFAGPAASGVDALWTLADVELGVAYAALVKDAVRARDAVLAQRYLAEAGARGRREDVSESVLRDLDKLTSAAKAPKVKSALVEKAKAREQEALAARRARLAAARDTADGTTDWDWTAEVLPRWVGEFGADDAARDRVRAQLPDVVKPPEAFDPRAWLALADACTWITFTQVDPESKSGVHLRLARKAWREDLYGFTTGPLMVVSALTHPQRVTPGLAAGELLCRRLEELLGPSVDPQSAVVPIPLHIYEDKESYVAAATEGASGSWRELAKRSVGFYDPNQDISRLFLDSEPTRDRGGERYWSTFLHELTHHWCDRHLSKGGGSAITPGYWVVEGIAECMSDHEVDLRGRKLVPLDAQLPRLDILAGLAPKDALPWDALFDMPQVALGQLTRRKPVQASSWWKLDQGYQLDGVNLFYLQSGAVCQYLLFAHGDGGAALKSLVRAWYDGSYKPGMVKQVTGVAPDELGKRVLAFCRQCRDGKLPADATK